jgi:hypothetical protein
MNLNSQKPASKWAPFCYSFGMIVVFGGFLFLVDGVWQSGWQYIQSTRWLAVKAKVVGCSIAGSWEDSGSPNSRNVWGESSQVRCTFDYETGGVAHESTTMAGSSIFNSGRRVYPAPKVTKATMREWIARHPPQSVLVIHYNPSEPNEISLAGADDELRSTLPYDRLLFGVISTVVGLGLVLFAKMVRRRSASV